ncbi:LOW QUALITY PROTEIN: polyprotein [Phytophthora megakarya]|uniref:Polyprotein n=1 Tax=Phytophthora megakarya TaxID=4795 RepID=A0A225WY48_9STRA|nr:LOW QUALITY PROTEIN: polyprotein [Phytophthora megakarya]
MFSKHKKKKSRRRRLTPSREPPAPENPPTESVGALKCVEGAPRRSRVIEVAGLQRDAAAITRLPRLSWKHFLRNLKVGEIDQVCLITTAVPLNSVKVEERLSRPKNAEPKLTREERFAAQSWKALRNSGNPVYDTAREFADIFPEKVSAELPADRGVRHKIDITPETKY